MIDERDHLAMTSAYFDGELADAEATAAAEHLATCAECQQLLETAVGIDAMTAKSGAADVRSGAADVRSGASDVRSGAADKDNHITPLRPRTSRRWIAGGAIAAIAAAAMVLVVVKPWRSASPAADDGVAIALAHDRVLEPRFSGAAFATHRPYVAMRGAGSDAAREAISLAQLAQLEQRGDRADLVAALAASGELARARDAATALPDSVAAEVDRAATALAAHDAEAALAHAYRALDTDPTSLPARWNLALAARDLALPHLARAAFELVAAGHEPGWSDEARTRAAAIADELAPFEGDDAAFQQRAHAMLAGGPPIPDADARRFPAYARIHFYDAVRLAPTKARLDALRPLAAALDAVSATTTATAAIDRVLPAYLGLRATFATDYRAVVEHRASAAEIASLLDRLTAGGVAVADLLVGTIILGETTAVRPHTAALAAAIAPWHDAWFDIALVRARAAPGLADHDLRVEPALADALATCTGDALALRCGQLADDLAHLRAATGFGSESEKLAATALAAFRRAVAPAAARNALASIADRHRLLGRATLARAELEDIAPSATGSSTNRNDCNTLRNTRIGLADLALSIQAWDRVRAALPPVERPAACTNPDGVLPIATATDLARHTRAPADVALAQRWIAAAQDPSIATIATLRISPNKDATATRAWLAAHETTTTNDPTLEGIRAWAITTLIDDAAAAGDWAGAIAVARTEHPRPASPTACTLVASLDDDRLAIAALHGGKAIGEARIVPAAELATAHLVSPAIANELRACDAIEVVARPPLHGRPDLLPAELPWYFVGDTAHPPAAPQPATARTLEVVDAHPPSTIAAAALPAMRARPGFDISLAGDAATPTATLAALATATYAELHVDGIAAAEEDSAAFLALSPDATGAFALRADAVRAAKLAHAPIVVLAACRASTNVAYLNARWSLPDAFVAAGAGAVVAVDRPIDDATARTVFDDLRRRVLAGEPIARAVAAVRTANPTSAWVQRLMVFE